jgi:flagellar export protein FliJ
MAKFNYKLQNFLNVKAKLEEQKRLEYGQAISDMMSAKQIEAAIKANKADSQNSMKNALQDAVDTQTAMSYNRHMDVLKRQLAKQEKTVSQKEAQAESKRGALIDAMREHKTVSKLRENAYAAHVKAEQLDEHKRLDEIAGYRFKMGVDAWRS